MGRSCHKLESDEIRGMKLKSTKEIGCRSAYKIVHRILGLADDSFEAVKEYRQKQAQLECAWVWYSEDAVPYQIGVWIG